jgi:hypothetical protein
VDTSVHPGPAEFRDSWLKLERGSSLADQFKASADEFLSRRPFTMTTTTDATHQRFTVWVTVEPPRTIWVCCLVTPRTTFDQPSIAWWRRWRDVQVVPMTRPSSPSVMTPSNLRAITARAD